MLARSLSSPALQLAGAALLLAGSASAQHSLASARPVTTQIKDAGTYHTATGTWTRGINQVALAGPEVIYDNTCTTGYYWGADQGEVALDSGRIPSTSSPSNATSLTGLYDNYNVNGFQIGYCAFTPVLTSLAISFTDCYVACQNGGILPPPLVTFNLNNIPGGTAAGSVGCWIVTIDLANTSGVFNLGGDCDGVYDNVDSTDSFGWTWTQTIPTTGSNSGPLLTGDPQGFFNPSCGPIGGGTTFPGAGAGPGSGIGVLDQFELSSLTVSPGCYWFGGYAAGLNPMGSFYMQLQADCACFPGGGTSYCFGDGTGANCPCSAFGAPGAGCANTGGPGATMVGVGNSSFSNDTLAMSISGVPGAKPGLLLKGDNQIAVPVGDGILCTAGGSLRSQVQITDAAGTTTFTEFNAGGVGSGNPLGSVANMGALTNYQFWYRDPMSTCSGAGFNFTNAWTVTYLP